MEVDARREAWVRLHATGLPARALVALLRAFGSPEAALGAPAARRNAHLTPAQAQAFDSGAERVEAALAWIAQPGHNLVAWDDVDYPAALLQIADPPPVLYAIGHRRL